MARKDNHTDNAAVKNNIDLAAIILSMPYGELVSFAEALSLIKRPSLVTAEDFAALLHDWAKKQ